ncbi:tetratricopeptide repeat protein, partial [Candidatus Poribacteria bacterium]|nr:tetratricopeptide repeat protein [Candidatus Poribacteria bacterium]
MTGRRTVLGRAAAWLLVALLVQPFAPLAFAQDATSETALLEEGRRQYEDLEWDEAVATLIQALDADLSPQQQADAYWLLALTTRALDDLEAAENYLYALIRVDPAFSLPETAIGTDFEPLFAAALGRADRGAPTINIPSPEDVERGKPVRIVAQVADESSVAEVLLAFRIPGAREDTVLTMTAGDEGSWTGEIPSAATNTPGSLAFVVSAKDEWQNVSSQRATLVVPKGGGNGFLYVVLAVLAAGGGLAVAALGG